MTAARTETIFDILSYFGEPFADSSAIPTFLVSKAIAKDVKAALSGDGADEIFMGYTIFQGTAIAKFLKHIPFKHNTAFLLRYISGFGGSRSENLDTIARRLDHASKPITKQLFDKQNMFSPELNYQDKCLSFTSLKSINEGFFFSKHLEILENSSVPSSNKIIARLKPSLP